MIKIVLYVGGSGGDMITVMHNVDALAYTRENDRFITLKENYKNFKKSMLFPNDKKLEFLEKCEGVCSSHDFNFVIENGLQDQTLLLTIEKDMWREFSLRYKYVNPQGLTSGRNARQQMIQWAKNNLDSHKHMFKNTLDVSDILTNDNFLDDKLKVKVTDYQRSLFTRWQHENRKHLP